MIKQISLTHRIVRRLHRAWTGYLLELLRLELAACGSDVSLAWPLTLLGANHVKIGNRVSINAYTHMWGQGGIEIGDDTLVASHVAITSLTHTPGSLPHSGSYQALPVRIGRNVWIGSHAVILPGVTIGDNAVIGAGSVVRQDVPAGARVAGVPARPITSHA